MAILGITDIGINLPLLVGQLINFTLLLIILRLFVYKPVLRMLDERRERIRAGLSAAEQGREREVEANRLAPEQLEGVRRPDDLGGGEGHRPVAGPGGAPAPDRAGAGGVVLPGELEAREQSAVSR